jgi:hypothetical protein
MDRQRAAVAEWPTITRSRAKALVGIKQSKGRIMKT